MTSDGAIVRQIRALVRESNTDLEPTASEVTLFYSSGSTVKAVQAYRNRFRDAQALDPTVIIPSLMECKAKFDALPPLHDNDFFKCAYALVRGNFDNVHAPQWQVMDWVRGGPLEQAYQAYLFRKK